MAKTNTEIAEVAKILQRLCSKIIGNQSETTDAQYNKALAYIGRYPILLYEGDDFHVAERIKRKLARQGRMQDAALFSELHRKFQAQSVITNRQAVLHLLLSLFDQRSPKNKGQDLFRLPRAHFTTSTPLNPPPHHAPSTLPADPRHTARHPRLTQSGGSYLTRSSEPGNVVTSRTMELTSGSSSGVSSALSSIPGSRRVHGAGVMEGGDSRDTHVFSPSYGSTASVNSRVSRENQPNRTTRLESKSIPAKSMHTHTPGVATRTPTSIYTTPDVSEDDLIRDLVFVLQDIDAKWIKFDAQINAYVVSEKAGFERGVCNTIEKLAELGWLYKKTKKYVTSRSTDKAFGLVGQSFCMALNQEMAEYYRLIAVLESQLRRDEDAGCHMTQTGHMTVRRAAVWMFDPIVRLRTLATLVDVCKGKKGGALSSAIHSYIQHGDPYIKSLVKHTLTMVSQPIYATILHWIYEGEMDDPFQEFFVASDPTVKDERLWNDKYRLRKSMIPSFITTQQANRILMIGKSINFLRQVCHDRSPIKSHGPSSTLDTSQGAESMFTQDDNRIFQQMMDSAYSVTSAHLLQVMHNKYKFMDHLQAMRRYLLLGQGDFIRHLMDLLQEDLAKSAGVVYLHNLTGFLDMAVRCTNAQYDDADILKRLDVRLLEVSPGDTGWDVFSLDYHVDGPIRTVFTPECIVIYLRVFNFLWRAKRMEYILALVWKQQLQLARTIKPLPALSGLLHHCHIIAYKMVHFVQQVQYYINFEVLECTWDELLTKVSEAVDLDHIIAAHQVFLDTIISRCLLDAQSTEILTKLRIIFDLTIEFQLAQAQFSQAVTTEMDRWRQFEGMKETRSERGEWAVVRDEEEVETSRRHEFIESMLTSTRPQLQVLATSYQDMVQEFLQMLTVHQDASLRFLSFRLDFNQYYNVKDPKSKRLSMLPRQSFAGGAL